MQKFRLILPEEFLSERPPEKIPDIKTFIHQRIKIALDLGRIPWKVPVSHDPNCGLPHNIRSGRRYRGVNTLLLCDSYYTKGFRSKWWGTAEDWESLGHPIQAGEEPTVIAKYCDGGWSREIDHSLVFNAVQVHGAEEYQALLLDAIMADDEADFGLMGMLIEHHAPDIRYDDLNEELEPTWSGAYAPPNPWIKFPNHRSGDYILMRSIENFRSKADHFSTLLHEFIHWTEVRTTWMHCMPVREFVAEVGMHILGLELGIPHSMNPGNHRKWASYWNLIATKDRTFFLWAMSQVDRACDFLLEPILGRKQDYYHDPWCIVPSINHCTGADQMSFEVAR